MFDKRLILSARYANKRQQYDKKAPYETHVNRALEIATGKAGVCCLRQEAAGAAGLF